MTSARARTRRRLAGLGLSLAVHGALLLAFMSVAPRLVTLPRLPAPPEPVVELELRRPADRTTATTSAATATQGRAAAAGATLHPPLRPVVRRSDLAAASPAPRAAPNPAPAPAAASGPPAGAAAGAVDDGRWRVQGDAGAAARALVRGTLGCADAQWLHLTRDERDHCNAEFVRGLRTLNIDGVPPAKRAYYDEVVARTEAERGQGPFDALLERQKGEHWRDHGVDMAAQARCAFRFGPGAARANRDDPCRLRLPLSPLTAETRVPPPPTLADRTADEKAAAKLDAPPDPSAPVAPR